MFLAVIGILAFNSICVTAQSVVPPQTNYIDGYISAPYVEPVTLVYSPPGTLSANLSTCGNTGATGPSLSQCRSTYNTVWSNDPAQFSVTNGIQRLKILESGRYRIEAYGANGGSGNSNNNAAEKGAEMIGGFVLNQGTILNIVIGQEGLDGGSNEPGGGGGGTFVYTGNIGENGLLIAAGGGGRGGEEDTRASFNGYAEVEAISHLGLSGHIGSGGIRGGKNFCWCWLDE